jgi:histone deacetylase complex regulatory component SIN3
LAVVGLILVMGGVFAFVNFRSIAKAHAGAQATKVAEVTAERVTNEYLQKELPDLLEAYRSFLDSEGLSDADADGMANAQDNDGEDKA